MKRKTLNYLDLLYESLKDKEHAAGYTSILLAEFNKDDQRSKRLILLSLNDIVQALGGSEMLANKVGLDKRLLEKELSGEANPRFSTILSILQAMDFQFDFVKSSERVIRRACKTPVKKPVLKRISLRKSEAPSLYYEGQLPRLKRRSFTAHVDQLKPETYLQVIWLR